MNLYKIFVLICIIFNKKWNIRKHKARFQKLISWSEGISKWWDFSKILKIRFVWLILITKIITWDLKNFLFTISCTFFCTCDKLNTNLYTVYLAPICSQINQCRPYTYHSKNMFLFEIVIRILAFYFFYDCSTFSIFPIFEKLQYEIGNNIGNLINNCDYWWINIINQLDLLL